MGFATKKIQCSHYYLSEEEKFNLTHHRGLNARGHKQVDGSHYALDSIDAPVTNPITVCFILLLAHMNPTWIMVIIPFEGAFLQGMFKNGEELYIKVPERFIECYTCGT